MNTCYYQKDFRFPQSEVHFHLYYSDFPELHDHDYWEFFIIDSGEIKHYSENEMNVLKAGTGILVHPSDKHCFKKCSQDYQQTNIMPRTNFPLSSIGFFRLL